MKRTLSPRDLAKALGVSESSLKRWADQGAVRVSRTAGGHRRITVPDAIDFVRGSALPLVRPEVLGLPELSQVATDVPRAGEESDRMLEHLIEGRAAEARSLVMWMFLNGTSMAEICDGPLRLALEHLGKLWTHRPDGIFIEHRATDICLQALHQIRATREIASDAPTVVGGAPAGDPYLLPSLMVATTLATEGIHAVNVGPQTPVVGLIEAARIHRPVFAWLSVTADQERSVLRDYVSELLEGLAPLGVPLMVGGRQSRRMGLASRPNLHRGDSIVELVAFARGLVFSADEHAAPEESTGSLGESTAGSRANSAGRRSSGLDA